MLFVRCSDNERISLGKRSLCLLSEVIEDTKQVHVAEFLTEFRKAASRDKLHKNSVVAFKGCVHVRIVLQGIDACFGHVSSSAAAFAAFLKGCGGSPCR